MDQIPINCLRRDHETSHYKGSTLDNGLLFFFRAYIGQFAEIAKDLLRGQFEVLFSGSRFIKKLLISLKLLV